MSKVEGECEVAEEWHIGFKEEEEKEEEKEEKEEEEEEEEVEKMIEPSRLMSFFPSL